MLLWPVRVVGVRRLCAMSERCARRVRLDHRRPDEERTARGSCASSSGPVRQRRRRRRHGRVGPVHDERVLVSWRAQLWMLRGTRGQRQRAAARARLCGASAALQIPPALLSISAATARSLARQGPNDGIRLSARLCAGSDWQERAQGRAGEPASEAMGSAKLIDLQ